MNSNRVFSFVLFCVEEIIFINNLLLYLIGKSKKKKSVNRYITILKIILPIIYHCIFNFLFIYTSTELYLIIIISTLYLINKFSSWIIVYFQ